MKIKRFLLGGLVFLCIPFLAGIDCKKRLDCAEEHVACDQRCAEAASTTGQNIVTTYFYCNEFTGDVVCECGLGLDYGSFETCEG
ncbi:MAG: hypothetical protein WC702_01195 [Patescibacteria group bacterium]|jgi:hypothetical protein